MGRGPHNAKLPKLLLHVTCLAIMGVLIMAEYQEKER